jgi:hypothetical protein
MATQPTEQQLVHTSTRTWKEIVQRAAGKDSNKPDIAYEFSNGRKFEDRGANGGPYQPSED